MFQKDQFVGETTTKSKKSSCDETNKEIKSNKTYPESKILEHKFNMDLRIKLSSKHVCTANIFKGKGYLHIFNNHKKSSISLKNDEFQKLLKNSPKIIKLLNTESTDKRKKEKKRKQEFSDEDDDDVDGDDDHDDDNTAETKKKINKKKHKRSKSRSSDQDTESD